MKSKVLILFLGLFFFIGCGGSGKTSTTSSDIGKGIYVDSEVDGVKYVCGSQIGLTGDTGVKGGFKYEKGKTCTFSINGINLSKVDGAKLTGDEIKVQVGDTDVAIFLQSLDIDGNPNNGITISSKVVEVLAENGIASLPETPSEVQSIVSLLGSKGIGYAGTAKTREEAQKHMAGFSVTMSATKLALLEGEEVSFAADVKGDTQGLTFEWVGYGVYTPEFSKDDFSAGEHVIVVNVTKGNITLSASQTIEVTPSNEFIVSIKSDKTNYTTDDTISLEANITGNAGSSPTYLWKDGDTTLTGTTKTVSQKFTAGEHNVTVEVTGRSITKSANFIFNVADMSDFNVTASTITQNSKGLMWVDAKSTNTKQTCLAIHGDEYNSSRSEVDDSFQRAKTFCNVLEFAGFTNWRTPTTEELSEYIKKTNTANIKTKYDRECWQLLALVDQGSDVSDGANYRAVTTRFMPTKWYPNIATIRTHNYTKSALFLEKYNVGLRCVRNIDNSGGEDIIGANINVSIIGAKANYIENEDVNLTANVTGASSISSYSWIENGVEIGSLATLSKNDFTIANHTVTLKVTADDVTKSRDITFSVSSAPNLTDFNITSFTANNDEVIIQKSTNLMWVNEHDATKGKCAKVHNNDENHTTRYETEFTIAKGFCKSSSFGNFAGKTGWRTPTKSELATFITSTINANILPAYDAKCKKLLALKDGATDEDANASYITVITRYGTSPGTESDLQPNIGLRCVRNNN